MSKFRCVQVQASSELGACECFQAVRAKSQCLLNINSHAAKVLHLSNTGHVLNQKENLDRLSTTFSALFDGVHTLLSHTHCM